ncbi:MAG: hypothetical protein JWM16_6170, partial [Verrucomicrobiales bacterium]|nr:hypothetical protein [Verrucomicrobiales bacterium]
IIPTTLQWRSFPTVQPGQPTYFPPGTNIVTWCLTDGQGFMRCCCFEVIVTNCPPVTSQCAPRLECPKEVQVQCEGGNGGFAFFPPPKVSDPCGVVIATNSTYHSGQFFPNGKTVVTYCITWVEPASGKQHTECCCFDVVVRCCPTNCVSTLNCPTNIIVDCPGPNGVILNYTITSSSNCGPTTIVCDPPSGSPIFGPTNVCCRLMGSSGAVLDRCCFPVQIKDSTPPSIKCPTNITVVSSNCGPVPVTIPAVTATDNCDPHPTVTCSFPATANVFPCGVTAIACTATDASGNVANCTFTVTVLCQSPTEIRCPEDITINCASANGEVVNYTVYATNRCTNIVSILCNPPSGTLFPPGSHAVCCVVEDGFGGKKECCFKVNIASDTIPPQISCSTNVVVVSPNCAPMDVQYPAPTASDNCKLHQVVCNPPSGSSFPVGTTTVTCCAYDEAGNKACCNFTVTVRCPANDCTRIVCSTNIVVSCAGPNGAPVNYNAYATNYCTGGILPVTCSRPSGSFFPLGITTVCCTNVSNNATQWCCFEVKVGRDTQPPVINCPTNIFILCAKANGTKVAYTVTATDNCDPTPTITCLPPSGSFFGIGCTNVTCVAVDDAGNSSTCTFKVCLLPQGCYLRNPSFEQIGANLPAALNCGDPISYASGWSAVAGTPDLFRPPYASLAPGNCRGRENPCQGTNYAGLEGGYTATGGFVTEAMMGTLVAPLNNGQKFRLRACLSLAESSSGPVLVEFVLANSSNLAQQQVIHQVWVTQKVGWMQYLPPCFVVPELGNWDRLIIRMAQVGPGANPYKTGYVYLDNVNICCCKPILHNPVLDPNGGVVVTWDGAGRLQATGALGEPTEWHDVETPVEMDPETGFYSTRVPRSPANMFFRVVGPDSTIDCDACSSGGS